MVCVSSPHSPRFSTSVGDSTTILVPYSCTPHLSAPHSPGSRIVARQVLLRTSGSSSLPVPIMCFPGHSDARPQVETDKATVDFEAQDEGFIAKLLVPEGATVAMGVPIAITVRVLACVIF